MLNEKVEYYGEMLSIRAIAIRENVGQTTLRKHFEEIGDIYEAVKKAGEIRKTKIKIEYNGKGLTITEIAREEGLTRSPLKEQYKKTKDIYKAVKICKENQEKTRSKIEYNGEALTLNAIAQKEGLSFKALDSKYKETEDIYIAVKMCKKKQEEFRGNIEYYGEKLTLNAISQKEGLTFSTLKKEYEKNGNIYRAIENCKDKTWKKIEYYGEKMTIRSIAKKEGIEADPLRKKFSETKDIYTAVEICKINQKKYNDRIEYIDYNGEKLAIESIAKKEGIKPSILRKRYVEYGNIYRAIEICKENQKKYNERLEIEYEGKTLTINAIAKKEGLDNQSLKNEFIKQGNIYKAVFICKNRQRNRRKRKEEIDTKKYGRVSYYDLSVILGIKYNELMNLVDKGYKVDEIIEMNLKPTRTRVGFTREVTKLSNGQTLREYCAENKLNYACIYRAMNVYGKSLEEAEDYYNKKGQQIPRTWIFEKYGLLLRHIMLRDSIDIDRVVKYMREEVLSLEEGVEKYIIRKNAKKEGLDEDWMEEIYGVLTDDNIRAEYDQYKRTFYVDDKEEENVIQSCDEVENFKRKMILFEIAEAIEDKTFTEEEEIEVLREYNITEQEIEIIFNELYKDFKEPGVLLGEHEPRKEMTKEEQERIQEKIEEYKRKVRAIRQGQDEDIIATMKKTVGKNVGENERTREELNHKITREDSQKV